MNYFNPGCGCGCCPTVGFDESAWSLVTSCCSGMSPIVNLASDVSRLGECRVVFGGNTGFCADAIRFDSGDWSAVGDYVSNGGRLLICAEHSGGCLSGAAELASFLTAIGSSMTYSGGDYNNLTPLCSSSYYTPGTANIAQGITFTGERFGEINPGSGASVWLGPTGGATSGLGLCAVAVEQIGDGFLFLSGDGNHAACVGYCDFIRRLWEYDDGDII